MYLEKLEIQGFKSFANKNKLIFSGILADHKRGLTAIVGPNGSGKSNVADSIRWALGEQSLKILRGKKSEDVIFSGSDRKNQLGLAEVSLYLNNADGAQERLAAPETITAESDLDKIIKTCPEIVITRRLYRSGESEYLLNGSRARLTDIQLFLAKANFGQKTYSVIGQGMVENFLNTTAAERKDFFDEATGVKQFQIKRDTALNKLEASYGNLQQVDMLLAEIKPRLRSLTRQVEKLNQRSQLETELKYVQFDYYHSLWQEINAKLETANSAYLKQEKGKREREKKAAKLKAELDKIKINDSRGQSNTLQPRLQALYDAQNQLFKERAKIQAELEVGLEAQGKFDLSWLKSRETELSQTQARLLKEAAVSKTDLAEKAQKEAEEKLAVLSRELKAANQALENLSARLAGDRGGEKQEEIKRLIDDFLHRLEEIGATNDLASLKSELKAARQNFKDKIASYLQDEKIDRLPALKSAQEKIIALNEERQFWTQKLSEARWQNASEAERQKIQAEQIAAGKKELAEIRKKIAKNSVPPETAAQERERQALEVKIDALSADIKKLEEELVRANAAQDEEKSLIFSYQRDLGALQEDINVLNNELNTLKIEATRQETKLEDLEANIRSENLDLSAVKNHPSSTLALSPEQAPGKINALKSQLEQIGGIDPETEKEYQETKTRYNFLSQQTADLDKTIKSLEEIIYELDANIKNRFDSEFKVIAEKFNDYFRILFSGGQAKIFKILVSDLEKEEEKSAATDAQNQNGALAATRENAGGLTATEKKIKTAAAEKLKALKFLRKHNAVGLAGIEIQATPPGKKIQSVAMLSGGERALTAIALICAIISANPSPFVVLDEVDASLDEANSERLAKILDDLSHKTQFIIITHNRASMRRASILYGVTMDVDGVSHLLSVKLDEIKEAGEKKEKEK